MVSVGTFSTNRDLDIYLTNEHIDIMSKQSKRWFVSIDKYLFDESGFR